MTNYFYDGDSINVLYETNSSGTLLRSYNYSATGQLLSMETGGQTYYYHYNAHGDVIALTNQSGSIVERYSYDSWGVHTGITTSSVVNPIRYAGYQYDEELGMYYLIARYYYPEQGVFLSLDPQEGDSDDVLTQNGYCYADNNTVNMVDPDGNASTYVFYYNKSGIGFSKQAKSSCYYNNKDVKFLPVVSKWDFISAWSRMSGGIKDIYMYLHGGTGELYFSGETLGFKGSLSFKSLTKRKVSGRVNLFSCKGGDGKGGNNVALMLKEKTRAPVRACTGKFSFGMDRSRYYARTSLMTPFGSWKTF